MRYSLWNDNSNHYILDGFRLSESKKEIDPIGLIRKRHKFLWLLWKTMNEKYGFKVSAFEDDKTYHVALKGSLIKSVYGTAQEMYSLLEKQKS